MASSSKDISEKGKFVIKTFSPSIPGSLKGIINYLSSQTSENIHDKGIIEVSSNSINLFISIIIILNIFWILILSKDFCHQVRIKEFGFALISSWYKNVIQSELPIILLIQSEIGLLKFQMIKIIGKLSISNQIANH